MSGVHLPVYENETSSHLQERTLQRYSNVEVLSTLSGTLEGNSII